MIGKYLIRAVGVLTCVAVVATGWDAEAGRGRQRHQRAASCCEPVVYEHEAYETVAYEADCCEPVACCEPVRETVCCAPQREIVIMPIVPVATCCNDQVVTTEAAKGEPVSVMKRAPAAEKTAARGVKATAAGLKR
jgi:hypothetical protein